MALFRPVRGPKFAASVTVTMVDPQRRACRCGNQHLKTMPDQKNKPTNERQQNPGANKPGSNATAQNKEQTPGKKTPEPQASDRVGGDAARTKAQQPQGSTQKPTGKAKP